MGHVLGFGTTWVDRNLVVDWGGIDPIYTGFQATAIWPQFNQALNYQGRPIPLEDDGPAGTRDAHWRESVFHTELMTGYVEGAGVPMPLSRLTIATLQDLGYEVNYAAADPFLGNLLAGPVGPASRLMIGDDTRRASWEVGPNGTLTPLHH
jgi:hypothetical protein